jgi:hypothetical protein
MSQLPDPTNNLSSEARRIYEQIVGSRGHDYPGLFRSLMLYPELAQRFAELGTLLRFDGVLRADIRELAILTVARELRIAYIWETLQENAAKAGLASTAVADLLCGKDLSTHDALYPPVRRLVQHFLQLKPIPQDLQDHLVATLGLAVSFARSGRIARMRKTANRRKPTASSDQAVVPDRKNSLWPGKISYFGTKNPLLALKAVPR